jgi:UDP-N-acetylmuramate--alanine ligase
VGKGWGIRVLDDYAHNPAKMAAAWNVAREEADRVLAVWRPHGFAPLRLMWDDLCDVLGGLCRHGDRLFLLPVYYAGGTVKPEVDSAALAARLGSEGAAVQAVSDYPVLEEMLASEARAGDTVVIMGARDPQLPRVARRLARRLCGG